MFNTRGGHQTRRNATAESVPPRIAYLGWLAATVSGVLFVAQGVFMMARDYNLDALPLALLLFSVGHRTAGWLCRQHRDHRSRVAYRAFGGSRIARCRSVSPSSSSAL